MITQQYENKVLEVLVNDGTPVFKQESENKLVIENEPPEVDKEESKLFFDVEIKSAT
jgi:hypothetical protein